MLTKTVEIVNSRGLHARSAAKIVAAAQKFNSTIEIFAHNKKADASSMMSLMILAAGLGTPVKIKCQGADEAQALEAICTLINAGFDEND